MMRKYTCFSPAKINLFLSVLSKNKDGYHQLLTDMVAVNLADEIIITPLKEKKFLFKKNYSLENQKDLIVKAIRLLETKTNQSFFLSIQAKKNIPFGAGLGGGSSNAATILLALNEIFSLNLTIAELCELGKKLGTDVPFFLYQKQLKMGELGDTPVSKIEVPSLPVMILKPSFSISTKMIYQNFSLSRQKPYSNKNFLVKYNKLEWQTLPPNDLYPVACKHYPSLKTYYQKLLETPNLTVQMSGSGSSLFAIYENEQKRELAIQKLKKEKQDYRLYSAEILKTWKAIQG